MGRHLRDNVSFAIPSGWTDITMTRLQGPEPSAGGPPPPSITMERVALRPGETVQTYYHRTLVAMGRQTDAEVIERVERKVSGRAALLIRARFKTPPGPMDQLFVFVSPGSEPEPVVTIFSITSMAAEADKHKPALLELLDTVRFDEGLAVAGPRSTGSMGPQPPQLQGPLPAFVPIPGERKR